MSSIRGQVQRRRINSSAMRSPSPDIANRSIIKDTQAPMGEVKQYLHKRDQSRSPRPSDVSIMTRMLDSQEHVDV